MATLDKLMAIAPARRFWRFGVAKKPWPEAVGRARVMMALHKYFAGLPFYRQHTLQHLFGTPISASIIFEQCEHVANAVQPVFNQLRQQAAGALHYHLDDTTNRILNQGSVEIADRKTGKLKTRTGIYTSGMMATLDTGAEILLFQTDVGHAGEWIDQTLKDRPPDASIPILMCDALSRNFPVRSSLKKVCATAMRGVNSWTCSSTSPIQSLGCWNNTP